MPMFQSTTKRGGKNNHIPDATGSKSSAEKMHLQYRDKKMLKHKFKNIVAIATR